MQGSAAPADLETLLQLVYLRFTAPRADPAIFQVMQTQMTTALQNRLAVPANVYGDAFTRLIYQNHPRRQPPTPELPQQLDLAKSFAFYKDRFADASDFTFVFVGTFDLAVMKPLVERYLGSLPSLHRNETWKNVGIRPPTGVVEKIVKKGLEPKSQAAIVFTGPFQYDQAHRIAIRALGSVLDTRLRETLREDLSGTYGVSASPNYSKVPEERYTFQIAFGCDPKRTDDLVKAVFKVIDALRADGPTEKEVNDARAAFLRDYETSTKQNGNVMTQIYLRYQTGEDVNEFFRLPEYYKRLDAATIKEAARTYLNPGNYVRVTLFPDTPPPATK
jgi:zinc protease